MIIMAKGALPRGGEPQRWHRCVSSLPRRHTLAHAALPQELTLPYARVNTLPLCSAHVLSCIVTTGTAHCAQGGAFAPRWSFLALPRPSTPWQGTKPLTIAHADVPSAVAGDQGAEDGAVGAGEPWLGEMCGELPKSPQNADVCLRESESPFPLGQNGCGCALSPTPWRSTRT